MEINVGEDSFREIDSGKKTAELQVNDPAFDGLKVGDSIAFCHKGSTIYRKVTGIYHCSSLQDVLKHVPLSALMSTHSCKRITIYCEDILDKGKKHQGAVLILFEAF